MAKLPHGKGNIIHPDEYLGLVLPPAVVGQRNDYTDSRLFLEHADVNVPSPTACAIGTQGPSKAIVWGRFVL